MCGICGVIALTDDARVAPDDLAPMTAALTHRGPDDDGVYIEPDRRCGLGFRRLSIIDVSGGHQPLANEDQSVWAIFNGEIYNYKELREELRARGHRFATNADSEVVVHLYEEHGAEGFERLAGMYAFAIWDQWAGVAFLVRDRFGKKPLVYAELNGKLYFASEAKAILALPGAPRKPDPQALHDYLLFQYVPAPASAFVGLRKLPPGSYLRVACDEKTPGKPVVRSISSPIGYWRLPSPPPFRGDYESAKHRLGELLTKAVEKRLMSDVPLGAFLSGGVDSSIVVGLMRKLGVNPLRTFSIGFDDPRYDETRYAREVARAFATEHHEHIVTPDAAAALETLAWAYDEPFGDSSAIPTYYVSKWTRASVTVALTGDGGDELMAGYDRYQALRLAGALDFLPGAAREMLSHGAGLLPRGKPKSTLNRAARFLAALGEAPARRYLSWMNVFTPAQLHEGYREDFRARLDFERPLRWFDGLFATQRGNAIDAAIYSDYCAYIPFDLMTKVDIASMVVSLECRAPFLDHELVEFALSLPLEWRMGKRLLKDWARDLLPPLLHNRPKMGFGVPVGEWFRGPLRGMLEDRLLATDSLPRQILKAAWLRGLIDAHMSGRANHQHGLWALLMLENWRRRWLSGGIE